MACAAAWVALFPILLQSDIFAIAWNRIAPTRHCPYDVYRAGETSYSSSLDANGLPVRILHGKGRWGFDWYEVVTECAARRCWSFPRSASDKHRTPSWVIMPSQTTPAAQCVSTIAFGWPFQYLRCYRWCEGMSDWTLPGVQGYEDGVVAPHKWPIESVAFDGTRSFRRWDLHWPGAMLSFVFVFAALYLCKSMCGMFVSLASRRAGLCRKCQYPLIGLPRHAPCPECGDGPK